MAFDFNRMRNLGQVKEDLILHLEQMKNASKSMVKLNLSQFEKCCLVWFQSNEAAIETLINSIGEDVEE